MALIDEVIGAMHAAGYGVYTTVRSVGGDFTYCDPTRVGLEGPTVLLHHEGGRVRVFVEVPGEDGRASASRFAEALGDNRADRPTPIAASGKEDDALFEVFKAGFMESEEGFNGFFSSGFDVDNDLRVAFREWQAKRSTSRPGE